LTGTGTQTGTGAVQIPGGIVAGGGARNGATGVGR